MSTLRRRNGVRDTMFLLRSFFAEPRRCVLLIELKQDNIALNIERVRVRSRLEMCFPFSRKIASTYINRYSLLSRFLPRKCFLDKLPRGRKFCLRLGHHPRRRRRCRRRRDDGPLFFRQVTRARFTALVAGGEFRNK